MAEQRRPETTDLYELLEVSHNASQTVIHAAFRALARDAHPDINPAPDAAQRFKALSAAYSVLSDPQERARYDLERMRARRADQATIHASPGASGRVAGASPRARAASPRHVALSRVSDDRVANLAGPALLGLITLAALLAFVLVFVWVLDPAVESAGLSGALLIDLPGR